MDEVYKPGDLRCNVIRVTRQERIMHEFNHYKKKICDRSAENQSHYAFFRKKIKG